MYLQIPFNSIDFLGIMLAKFFFVSGPSSQRQQGIDSCDPYCKLQAIRTRIDMVSAEIVHLWLANTHFEPTSDGSNDGVFSVGPRDTG